jgi:hypothetical protein
MAKSPAERFGVCRVSVNSSASQSSVSPEKELAPHPNPKSVLETWVNRLAMIMFVSLCAVFGVLLVIVPWTPKWTDNYILISYPALRDLMENGFVRGVCSGFGVIDLWIGFWEASHYHEHALAESSSAVKS